MSAHCDECCPSFQDCWNDAGPCRKLPLKKLADLSDQELKTMRGELENKLLLQAQEIEILKRDAARLDWLEAHPLPGQVHGGSEDGIQAKFWAISCHPQWTLREAIDAVAQAKGASNE